MYESGYDGGVNTKPWADPHIAVGSRQVLAGSAALVHLIYTMCEDL